MPMRLDDLHRFEEMYDNNCNVNGPNGEEAAMRYKFVYPLWVTKLASAEAHH